MGIRRRGLFHLRQEARRDDADDWRRADGCRVLRGEQLVVDVTSLHRADRRGLSAGETRLLTPPASVGFDFIAIFVGFQ